MNTLQEDWEYKHKISLPFTLQTTSGKRLECQEVLRNLPGRRLVCRADQDDKSVLVKIFMGKRAEKDALTDANGVTALMKNQINTPRLLEQDSITEKNYPLLIFEFLPNVKALGDAWKSSDTARQEKIVRHTLFLVGQLHAAGLKQKDFHLENFLVNKNEIVYAIDGGDFLVSGSPLSIKLSLEDLGMMFGHFPKTVLNDSPDLLDAYFEASHHVAKAFSLARVVSLSDQFRKRRASMISKKAFRNCSEFEVFQIDHFYVYKRRDIERKLFDQWLRKLLLNGPPEDELLLKAGNSQTVWKDQLGENEIVIKQYNIKSRAHAVKRGLSRSRASRSWENAHRLRAYHIRTPKPLCMIEERAGRLRQRAWYVSANVRGESLAQTFSATASDDKINQVVNFIKAFAVNGLVHGDMKATNFIDDGQQLFVIDLDAMREPVIRSQASKGIAKDHKRFIANWEEIDFKQKLADLLSENKR